MFSWCEWGTLEVGEKCHTISSFTDLYEKVSAPQVMNLEDDVSDVGSCPAQISTQFNKT